MVVKTNIKFDNKRLKKLNEMVQQNQLKARVGVLDGSKKEKDNNGEEHSLGYIAMINEFGSVVNNIPARSFIREPLENHLKERIEKNKKKFGKLFFEENNIYGAYSLLGFIGERIIKEAFRNKNDGQWEKNAPITINGGIMRNKVNGAFIEIKGKGKDNPLINTGRLRRAITSGVIKNV